MNPDDFQKQLERQPLQHEPMTGWNLQRAGAGLLANRLTDAQDVAPLRPVGTALGAIRG